MYKYTEKCINIQFEEKGEGEKTYRKIIDKYNK